MGTRELTQEEREFAEEILAFFRSMEGIRAHALEVRAAGGDVKTAVLSLAGEDSSQRAWIEMQWPMFSLMLGVG